MELQAVKTQVGHAVDNLLHLGERVEIAHDIYHHAAHGIVGPVFYNGLGHSGKFVVDVSANDAAVCQRAALPRLRLARGYRQPVNSGLSATLTVFSDNILPSRHFFCDVILTFFSDGAISGGRAAASAEGPR